ncbi:MAG TPA: polysaccharide deacetylase family protein [Candidatus Caenarcaniphilales bacterium]
MAPQQWLVAAVAQVFQDAIFFKKTTERVVALTIDDGPNPDESDACSVPMILDAIAQHNRQLEVSEARVRATFFILTSHLGKNTTLIKQMLQQGHEIGNHGVVDESHASLTPKEFEQQLRQAHERLSQCSNQRIRWYRPGHGLYNREMLNILRRMDGYEPRFALASMIPLDTRQPTNSPRFTACYASQFVFPGSILVLHDGTLLRAQQTQAALKVILAHIRQRGYRVVTLSELWDL